MIALDAKGVPRSRITAHQAASLLAEASEIAKKPIQDAKVAPRTKPAINPHPSSNAKPPTQAQPAHEKKGRSTQSRCGHFSINFSINKFSNRQQTQPENEKENKKANEKETKTKADNPNLKPHSSPTHSHDNAG